MNLDVDEGHGCDEEKDAIVANYVRHFYSFFEFARAKLSSSLQNIDKALMGF